MNTEMMMNKLVGEAMQDGFDFNLKLTLLSKYGEAMLEGYPFKFVEDEEIYEEVNGHGNETGNFNTRLVRKALWRDRVWSEYELNAYLKENI